MIRFLAAAVIVAPLCAGAATEIPDVIVSAARTEQSTLTTPAGIRIITREQIAASGARHVVDVLRGQGAVQISDPYGGGSRTSVGMRGFGETANANTLVLVDGRRLNNPDIAAPDLNSIPIENVQRIEIVQGSAGVLFGDQAVGGVINIITRAPAEAQHELSVSGGSYATAKLHGSSSRKLDNGVHYRLSLDATRSDNYRDHNESRYYNVFGRVGHETDSGETFVEYQYINDELNTPGTLFDDEVAADRRQVNPVFAGDFSDLITRMTRFGTVQQLDENWSAEGEWTLRNSDGEFRLSSVFGAETRNASQRRNVNEFTPRLVGVLPGLNHALLTVGVDLISSEYQLSSRFGDQFNDQSQQSLYAQAVIPAGDRLDITVGYRHAEVDNRLRDTGLFAIYPSGRKVTDSVNVGELGLAWQASESTRWLLRADQNYRFAKVDEFMQPAFTPSFTPVLLDTQTGISWEGGVEWRRQRNRAKLLLYRLELDDEIAFDPVNFANINLDETRREGLIGEFSRALTPDLDLSASYTYTDAEVVSGPFQGREVPFVAEHSGRVSVDYRLSAHWQFYAEAVAISERVFSGDFDNVLQKLPGHGVVNVKAQYNWRRASLAARINNLFDNEYTDVGQLGLDPANCDPVTFVCAPRAAFFPSPELNFMLTAAVRFR